MGWSASNSWYSEARISAISPRLRLFIVLDLLTIRLSTTLFQMNFAGMSGTFTGEPDAGSVCVSSCARLGHHTR
jgi:hypothetical protein